MHLRSLRRQWTILGKTDPYWAILTVPGKENNGWDVAEFFATGVAEIDAVMRYVEARHPLISHRRALDFGCGAGRLTQALALHFEEACGVDISAPMIELAGRHNRFGERCRYVLNERADLSVFPDRQFDFVYSNITLQHMQPRLSRAYLREFVRVLAPGGALLFQLPSHLRPGGRPVRVLSAAYGYFWWLFRRPGPYAEMHGERREAVVALLERAGARVVDVAANENAGPGWHSLSYLAARG